MHLLEIITYTVSDHFTFTPARVNRASTMAAAEISLSAPLLSTNLLGFDNNIALNIATHLSEQNVLSLQPQIDLDDVLNIRGVVI